MNRKRDMDTVNVQTQQKSFFEMINELEMDYHLYFGLKSIQKGLLKAERIYDHFKLNMETLDLSFSVHSDLPQEIRERILYTYHTVFSEKA